MDQAERPVKRDRRPDAERPCLKPTLQNPGAVTLARVKAGLNQKELALAAGISPSYMSEIEGGTRSATAPKLRLIAAACGTTVPALLNPEMAAMRGAALARMNRPAGANGGPVTGERSATG